VNAQNIAVVVFRALMADGCPCRDADTASATFPIIVFTFQTVGLVASDSVVLNLREHAPTIVTMVEFIQSGLNPGSQTPESCLFPTTLAFKLLIEAVVQPVYAFCILAAVCIPWHFAEFSCGFQGACNARRAVSDMVAAKLAGKRLRVKWVGGNGVLVKGTWAKVAAKTASDMRPPTQPGTRTVAFADCDANQILVSHSTIGAPKASDFEHNDVLQLWRLLRALHLHTSDNESKTALLHTLRCHVDCDDLMFDNAKMPTKLTRPQITQACE
jgi:hypothetical protein